ncbi:hypothetical protein [Flavobacterium cellulosilyticum]|uniref:Lipoprotein n=1 Tax=Flavobacterium cellulosilyticum TaxID=2541731 RepID=A0A4R5CAJ4_9FLAO|nr:hypothetical protein [Flavobacterium cellulosilyticum]TDD96951.1 hypothetical protein E0F76_09920 [Flavobacterium cellulosilyticum]
MKKNFLLIIIGLCTLFSCKKTSEKAETISTSIHAKKKEIYTSADTKSYLDFDKEFNEYKIAAVKDPQKFSTEEMAFEVKENDFNFTKSDHFDYYTIKSFDLGDTNFKVILYSTFGENDSKVANIQLNSYRSGVQVDALLLDSRFEFETEYYRNFVIKNDKTIEIKKMSVDKLLYNVKGDIIGNRKVNDTLIDVVSYKVNPKGEFLKLL